MIPVSPALVAALARALTAVDRALASALALVEPEAPAATFGNDPARDGEAHEPARDTAHTRELRED